MNFTDKFHHCKSITNVLEARHLLDDGIAIQNMYCICINLKTKNLIDIIHSTEFTKEIYNVENYVVLGLCIGKKETFNLVSKIIEAFYTKNNTLLGFRTYYLDNFKDN